MYLSDIPPTTSSVAAVLPETSRITTKNGIAQRVTFCDTKKLGKSRFYLISVCTKVLSGAKEQTT